MERDRLQKLVIIGRRARLHARRRGRDVPVAWGAGDIFYAEGADKIELSDILSDSVMDSIGCSDKLRD